MNKMEQSQQNWKERKARKENFLTTTKDTTEEENQ